MAAGVDYFHKERLGASLTSDCGDWFAEVYRIRLRHKIARAAAKDLLQRRPQGSELHRSSRGLSPTVHPKLILV